MQIKQPKDYHGKTYFGVVKGSGSTSMLGPWPTIEEAKKALDTQWNTVVEVKVVSVKIINPVLTEVEA